MWRFAGIPPFPRRNLPSPAASGNILLLLPSPMSQRITVIQDKYSPGHTFAEGVAATAATAIGAAVGLRVGFGILTSDMSPAKQAVEKGSNKLRLGVGKLRTAVRMTTSGGPESFWKSTFAAVLSEDEQLLSVYACSLHFTSPALIRRDNPATAPQRGQLYVSTRGVAFISDHPDAKTSALIRYYLPFSNYMMVDSALPGAGNVPLEVLTFSNKSPSVQERYWFTDFVSYAKARCAVISARCK